MATGRGLKRLVRAPPSELQTSEPLQTAWDQVSVWHSATCFIWSVPGWDTSLFSLFSSWNRNSSRSRRWFRCRSTAVFLSLVFFNLSYNADPREEHKVNIPVYFFFFFFVSFAVHKKNQVSQFLWNLWKAPSPLSLHMRVLIIGYEFGEQLSLL